MKTALTSLATLLLTFIPLLHAANPTCEITAHCYAMTAKDASDFTLTFNPAGQAGFSMEQLDKWVAEKKAVSVGTLSTKGGSGLHLQTAGKDFSLDTETAVSPSGSNVDIISTIAFPDQKVVSNVVCNNNQFVFAGNSTPENPSANPTAKVYFVYLLSRIANQ